MVDAGEISVRLERTLPLEKVPMRWKKQGRARTREDRAPRRLRVDEPCFEEIRRTSGNGEKS